MAAPKGPDRKPKPHKGRSERAALADYREEYCEDVVESMGRGLSLTAFAGEIGVARSDVDIWVKRRSGFAAAVARGKARRVLYLEQRLLEGGTGPHVSSQIFALKHADPDEWPDKPASAAIQSKEGVDRGDASTPGIEKVERIIVKSENSDGGDL
ncbi:MAG: hypothetical protein QNJ84_18920 [Alphaproteobacteria bacterium]|nr:hypothetical protein [Alphaproteobacteria bacterium]